MSPAVQLTKAPVCQPGMEFSSTPSKEGLASTTGSGVGGSVGAGVGQGVGVGAGVLVGRGVRVGAGVGLSVGVHVGGSVAPGWGEVARVGTAAGADGDCVMKRITMIAIAPKTITSASAKAATMSHLVLDMGRPDSETNAACG